MVIIIILVSIIGYWIYSKSQLTEEEKLINYIAETFENNINEYIDANSHTGIKLLRIGTELNIITTENSLLFLTKDLSVKYGIPQNKVINLIQSVSVSMQRRHVS